MIEAMVIHEKFEEAFYDRKFIEWETKNLNSSLCLPPY